MAVMFALRAVHREFEPWSGKTKYSKISMCCFFAEHGALRRKIKYLNQKICPSWTTCLGADCCFTELALQQSNEACWSNYLLHVHMYVSMFFITVIYLTASKMVPGLARTMERVTKSSMFLIIGRNLNLVKIRGWFYTTYKIHKLLQQ
jgi:hypothetical protein